MSKELNKKLVDNYLNYWLETNDSNNQLSYDDIIKKLTIASENGYDYVKLNKEVIPDQVEKQLLDDDYFILEIIDSYDKGTYYFIYYNEDSYNEQVDIEEQNESNVNQEETKGFDPGLFMFGLFLAGSLFTIFLQTYVFIVLLLFGIFSFTVSYLHNKNQNNEY